MENTMDYEFGGSLYRSHRAMVDAMVHDYMTANGMYDDETVHDFLQEETDESLVDECIKNMYAPEELEEVSVDRDDLLAAMARFRKEHELVNCPCRIVRGDGADDCEQKMRRRDAVDVTYINAYDVETARKIGSASGMLSVLEVHPDCADDLDRETAPDGRLDDAFIVY